MSPLGGASDPDSMTRRRPGSDDRPFGRSKTERRGWHHQRMDTLTAALAVLVAIVALRVVAVRVGVPYPTVFVIGGLGLSLVPGLPHLTLEPDLVLLLILPPLLFAAAFEIPQRELRANIAPIARLAIGLVVFTMILVAALAQWLIPDLGWPAAFTL